MPTNDDAQQNRDLLASIRGHVWGSNAAYLLIFGALFYLQRQVDVANLRADMRAGMDALRIDLAEVRKQVVQSQTVNVERPLTSDEERAIWIGKRAEEIRRAKANHESEK